MTEQNELIEASRLFKDVAQKSLEDKLAFGAGAVYGTANEFKGSQTPEIK
jgi:hypothetical protein